MIETVKVQYDHDAKIFIEKLLQNGYWVRLENCKTTSERMHGCIIICFEKDDEDDVYIKLNDESED